MKKIISLILLLVLVIGGIIGYGYYKDIMNPNTGFDEDSVQIKIPTGTSYEQLIDILNQKRIVADIDGFGKAAELMKYDKATVKSGLYTIKSGWSSRKIIQALRLGKQTPVKLSFNNVRTIESLAGKISKYIESDSLSLLKYIGNKETMEKYQLDKDNILSLFIPNTYEVYWNITPEKLLKKMDAERTKFWNKNNRLAKADKLGFTKEQVYTLASIVEKETQANSEKSRIAGVYINRIKRGIPLQADPTVVFALKKFDLKRVLLKHLEVDSPYNTYKHAGLPPGPIYMPSISSINAVLSPEKHKYIYFCAKPDGSGQHAFAKTLTEHNRNAKTYQRWLSKNRIR